jgi:glycosyltransferase involved in cell wall biosynthesis
VEIIINQTYKNLEIILVDDGSADNCGKICDEYAQKDNRIIVIHKENGGLSDARNKGLDIATGEYIGFVDSDDFIALEFYEILYKTLIETDSDLAFCGFQRFHNEDEIVRDFEDYQIETYKGIDVLNDFYNDEQNALFVVAWNKLSKKSIWQNLRFPCGKYHEDEFIAHEIYLLANNIAYVKRNMYYYFQREESIMLSNDNRFIMERRKNIIEGFNERINFMKLHKLDNIHRRTVDLRNRQVFILYEMYKRHKLIPTKVINDEIEKYYHTFSLRGKIKFFTVKYFPYFYFLYKKILLYNQLMKK